MMGQTKLGLSLQMTVVAGLGILPGIGDKLTPPTPRSHVQAPRSMTRLTPIHLSGLAPSDLNLRMTTHRENPGDIRMAFEAGLVANKGCPLDMRRHHARLLHRAAGTE